MQLSKIPFHKISALAARDVFYQENYKALAPFIAFEPTMDGIEKAIAERKKYPVDRTLLTEVLASHYEGQEMSEKQYHHLYLLHQEDTFTIVTAHQPSLLGGPAYYFYKIYSVLNLCKQLAAKYPDLHFVPVFISGAEDHDFDEISTVKIFGKSVTWETQQSGATGRFTIDGLDDVVAQCCQILGPSPKANQIAAIFKDALDHSKTYNEFVFKWVNAFFKEDGLLFLNMDDPKLKQALVPLMKRELLENISSPIVMETQSQLLEMGFRPQAFARDINLFYMMDGQRERITHDQDGYKINHTDLCYSESEMLHLLHTHPERFSPNVVMRPLYQETILPNLAYIGGGGELAYWLERKAQFEAFGVFFPTLIRRNSVMIIPQSLQKTMEKLSVTEADILLDDESLINQYLQKSGQEDFHLTKESQYISDIFESIAVRAKTIDPTLVQTVIGESHKTLKVLEGIETRLKRSIKQKEETQINQLKALKSKLFPNNGLQERSDSYLQYYIQEDIDLHQWMLQNLNPLEPDFLFLYL
jgi:bacillithiol biosynthesis cysteine-adding enzyme BshC